MKLGVCIWSGLHWTHSSVQLNGTEHKDSRPCFLFFLWLKFRKPKERDTGGKQIWSKAMLCIGWETITGRKSGVFSPSLKFYFLRSLVVGCIFDTNDNISRYTKKRGRVCLLLEGLVFWFFSFFFARETRFIVFLSLLQACHSCLTSKHAILIIDSHLLSMCTIARGPTAEPAFHIFGLFIQDAAAERYFRAPSNKQLCDLQATSGLALIIRVSGCWWN